MAKSDKVIWDLWLSQYWFSCIRAAREVGIFRHLSHESIGLEELAGNLQLDLRATRAVIGMLEALQLVVTTEGVLRLTPDSQSFLVPGSERDWGAVLKMGEMSPQEGVLLSALREGTDRQNGVPNSQGLPQPGAGHLPVVDWARGQIGMEKARTVASMMEAHSLSSAQGLAEMLEFQHETRLLDVGGGSGCYSIALAQHHPQLRCTVLDLEKMCEVARGYIQRAGMEGQVTTQAANMFVDEWPAADLVLLSNVLHDWRPETGQQLLRSAWECLDPGGQIWIHEMLLGRGGRCAAAFSVLMMLGTQGQQFRFEELQEMLESVGFSAVEERPAAGYFSLVTAVRN